jgi:hypothetical protein
MQLIRNGLHAFGGREKKALSPPPNKTLRKICFPLMSELSATMVRQRTTTPEERRRLNETRVERAIERRKKKRLDVELGHARSKDGMPSKCDVKGTRTLITTVLEASKGSYESMDQRSLKHEATYFPHRQAWVLRQDVRTADLVYADWFWRNNHDWHFDVALYPNIKEITESAAAYHQLVRHCPNLLSSNALCLVVGDGCTPRTGALLSLLAPSHQVWSIDPCMSLAYSETTLHTLKRHDRTNLHLHVGTVEEFVEEHRHTTLADAAFKQRSILLVAVHSHAELGNYVPQIRAIVGDACALWLLAIPCCVKQTLTLEQLALTRLTCTHDELDWSIQSPMRRVMIWQPTDD